MSDQSQSQQQSYRVLHLRLIKGVSILKDEKGNIANQKEEAKVIYGTFDYNLYLKNIPLMGYNHVEVIKTVEFTGSESKEIETPTEIIAELKLATTGGKEPELTHEQKTIAALMARLEALEGKGNDDDADEELKAARERYFDVVGKKGGPKWTVDEINTRISEFEATQK